MNVSGVERLRRELKTVLGILERRKPWHPFSTPSALFAHARQLTRALRSSTEETVSGGECDSFEERLRNARANMR